LSARRAISDEPRRPRTTVTSGVRIDALLMVEPLFVVVICTTRPSSPSRKPVADSTAGDPAVPATAVGGAETAPAPPLRARHVQLLTRLRPAQPRRVRQGQRTARGRVPSPHGDNCTYYRRCRRRGRRTVETTRATEVPGSTSEFDAGSVRSACRRDEFTRLSTTGGQPSSPGSPALPQRRPGPPGSAPVSVPLLAPTTRTASQGALLDRLSRGGRVLIAVPFATSSTPLAPSHRSRCSPGAPSFGSGLPVGRQALGRWCRGVETPYARCQREENGKRRKTPGRKQPAAGPSFRPGVPQGESDPGPGLADLPERQRPQPCRTIACAPHRSARPCSPDPGHERSGQVDLDGAAVFRGASSPRTGRVPAVVQPRRMLEPRADRS